MNNRGAAEGRTYKAILTISSLVLSLGISSSYAIPASASPYSTPACTVSGTSGDDILTGTAGNDVICGLGGNDTLNGQGGDDVLLGGAGNDSLNGGAGNDTLDYAAVSYDLNVNLSRGRAYGEGTDSISGFETVIGGLGDDVLTGDGLGNSLYGRGGNDSLQALGGTNTMDGGDGQDTVSYSTLGAGVTANLVAQSATAAAYGTTTATIDTYSSIENLVGSPQNDILTGSDVANQISGEAGNDTLNGQGGDDTLSGQGGDDTLAGGSGSDTVNFESSSNGITVSLVTGLANGEGSDTLAEMENITGSRDDDTITGNAADNLIAGGLGNDVMDGGAGINVLDYSDARSAVVVNLQSGSASGGSGSDAIAHFTKVIGSQFNDTLTGDSAENVFVGGAGNDQLSGGAGQDKIEYLGSLDMQVDLGIGQAKGDGTDSLTGIENVSTGSGNDNITGNSDLNVLSGGAGVDTISGGDGNDSINCGGQAGDTVSYSYSSSTVSVVVNLELQTGVRGLETDTIASCADVVGGLGNDSITGNSSENKLTGGAGNDTIRGGAGNDHVNGGAGNDFLAGGSGIDTLDYKDSSSPVVVDLIKKVATGNGRDTLTELENVLGGTGNDSITGSNGPNVIEGGPGNDKLNGGGGLDTVSFASFRADQVVSLIQKTARGDGTDSLANFENIKGGLGNDTLIGDNKANTLDGGAGDDVLIGGLGNDLLNGESGKDTASFTYSSLPVNASLTSGLGKGQGTDRFSSIENLTGGNGADTLTGDGNSNVLNGGVGADKHFGSSGDDTLIGGLGNDTFTGGTGFDLVDFSSSNGYVQANLGTQRASGSEGNDQLLEIEDLKGTGGNDVLIGDDNRNIIQGGGGNDNISGLGGDDTIFGNGGDDLMVGGSGSDTVSFATSFLNISASLVSNSATGEGSDSLNGIENVSGGEGADVLIGSDAPNTLDGGAGADLLVGNSGDDTLLGGAGNDRLDGGLGNDFADGQSGRNICRVTETPGDLISACPFLVNFEVSTARFVSGTYTDYENNPISLASVSLINENFVALATTFTDIRGNYAFVAPVGNYSLQFGTQDDKSLDDLPSKIDLSASIQIVNDASFNIKTPSTIRILTTVYDSNGEPVVGATVFTSESYSSGQIEVSPGVYGSLNSTLGGVASRTDSNGQLNLPAFAIVSGSTFTLRAIWLDAQGVSHTGATVLNLKLSGTATITLN